MAAGLHVHVHVGTVLSYLGSCRPTAGGCGTCDPVPGRQARRYVDDSLDHVMALQQQQQQQPITSARRKTSQLDLCAAC